MVLQKKSSLVVMSVLFNIGLFAACDGDLDSAQLYDSQSHQTNEQAIIVGGIDWESVTQLADTDAKRIESRKVAHLDLPALGSRCTGFLVSDNVIMTNQHCVESASGARGVVASFKFEDGVSPNSRAEYDCSTFIGNNASLDYALLRCEGNPGQEFGYVTLESRVNVPADDSIYVIHQNCDYYTDRGCSPTKKLSEGLTINNPNPSSQDIAYDADTLGGSSGSPVFATDNNSVIGIHHYGLGGIGNGRGSHNSAVPMSLIIRDIQARFSDVLDSDPLDPLPAPDPDFENDTLEPNNTVSDATLVTDAFENTDLNLHDGEDKDVFKVVLSSEGSIQADVTFSHSGGDIDVKLLDSNGEQLVKSDSASNDETISKADLAAGEYYIEVYGYQGATNEYGLRMTIEQVAPPEPPVVVPSDEPGDALEPNNSVDTASNATLAYSHSDLDLHDESDEDVFKITLEETTDLLVKLAFIDSDGDVDVKLLASDGRSIKKAQSSSDNETLSQSSLAAGDYYVVVYGYRGATNEYSIDISGQ